MPTPAPSPIPAGLHTLTPHLYFNGDCGQAIEFYQKALAAERVEDCDRLFDRAVKAGCEAVMPPVDMFWGDRMCKVKDPFGHCWDFATNKWIMTPQEVERGQKEWIASMKKGH
jgi:uncharacterized glyoxalase superfamily protein PhnB